MPHFTYFYLHYPNAISLINRDTLSVRHENECTEEGNTNPEDGKSSPRNFPTQGVRIVQTYIFSFGKMYGGIGKTFQGETPIPRVRD